MSKAEMRKMDADKESIEFKIDRVNNRILEFMNNSLLSCNDSDIFSPLVEGGQKRFFEDTELSVNEKYLICDE